MTEMSECLLSYRRENTQKRTRAAQQLQQQPAGQEPSSSVALMNRFTHAKERTDVVYDVLKVGVMIRSSMIYYATFDVVYCSFIGFIESE